MASTGDGTARRVPNGKVYRQIFDAQAQLVQALGNRQGNDCEVDATTSQIQSGIPVVQEPATERPGGVLTERQRSWMVGEPNDPYTENPVFHRQVAELVSEHIDDYEDTRVEGREVQALPDVVIPAKMGSNIIDRIAESRRQRHEASVEDMYQEMAVISSELEPRIVEAGEKLMEKLAENDEDIERIWKRVENDEDMSFMEREDLYDLWLEIQDHSTSRRSWIEELDQELDRLEVDRVRMIRDVFSSYSDVLGKIAHLKTPDLQRFLDNESQSVNQAILSNRRGYSDLYARLMILDIEREKRQYTAWCRRVDDWKRVKTQTMVDRFKEFMSSHVITKPDNVTHIVNLMRADLGGLNARRLERILSLRDMRPPQSTKTLVYQWHQDILDLTKQIDTRGQHYLRQLHQEYEVVCEKGLDRVEVLKAELMEAGVCNEHQAKLVVNQHCIPVIGERQKLFEDSLEEMDRKIEAVNKEVVSEMKSLFKFAQGAAHVWDQHEIGTARQERTLVEKMENARKQHDIQNQDRETNLDIVMDRMRQDATEPALREDLKKALDLLEKIKETYHAFHAAQNETVAGYPGHVRREVLLYDEAVCKFFAVDRSKRQKPAVLFDAEDDKKKRGRANKDRKYDDGGLSPEVPSSNKPSAVAEVLSTAKGTDYYVLTEAGEHFPPETPDKAGSAAQPEAEVFLTETKMADEEDSYLDCITIESGEFIGIKKQMRMNYLEHLDTWPDVTMDKAQNLATAKTEELRSELDLRLHLHQPRPRRAEMDIHNVRAAELIMHSERVTRHCKGINQALTDLKQRFIDLSENHDQLLVQFRRDVESLETVFINATKSTKLIALTNRLTEDQDKFMTTVRTSLRQFRQSIDDTLQMLRDSNARFMKSFKLFSDGGNFCPEEIDEYRKRLEKMAQLIDTSEGSLMEELEGMESKRLEQATRVSHEFEDKFKNHMVDLIFIEKITRWMTNTQVKIKAEVAFSNSMTGKIVDYLKQLERRVDACEKPSFDKEKITPEELHQSLTEIFEAFQDRSVYLDCLLDMNTPQSPMQGPPAVAVTRVGFTSDVTPVSKAGMKQPLEDPSVNVIKTILKNQKVNKLKCGFDSETAEKDTDAKTSRSYGTSRTPTEYVGGQSMLGAGDKQAKALANNKSRAGASSSLEGRRLPSGGRRGVTKSRVDKKYFVFGEETEDEEEVPAHFLAKIKRVCRDALSGLLTSAETYYRHKGSRPVTRPELLQESFDPCAELIVHKLHSYYNQSDEYHNECLQEFRRNIEKFEQLVTLVPPLVVNDLTKRCLEKMEASMSELDQKFEQGKSEFEKRKQEHHTELRPKLGHPQMSGHLLGLVDKEESRCADYLQRVDEYASQLRATVQGNAEEYVGALARLGETILLEFDAILIVNDVERGRVPIARYPTSELLRRKNAGANLVDDEPSAPPPRQKKNWPGLPKNELCAGEKPAKVTKTASVTTAKVTKGHVALLGARDKSYQEYKTHFQEILAKIAEQQETLITDEKRWKDNWLTWVAKVKLLY